MPKKTSRTAPGAVRDRGRGPRARVDAAGWPAAHLAGAHVAQRLAAHLGLDPVEEQHAVEVVDLVLDHAGEEVVALEHDLVAVEVEARAW